MIWIASRTAMKFARLLGEADLLPGLHLSARNVDPLAVDQHVAVGHELAGLMDREREPETEDHGVDPGLELLEQLLAGHAHRPVRALVVLAHLPLAHRVDRPHLLLLDEPRLVLGDPLAATAVHAGWVGPLVGRTIGAPTQRGADTSAHAVLGSDLVHRGQSGYQRPFCGTVSIGSEPVDDLRERVVGCVLGLALGDALGAPFEFRRRERDPRSAAGVRAGLVGSPAGHVDRRHRDGAQPLALARRAPAAGSRTTCCGGTWSGWRPIRRMSGTSRDACSAASGTASRMRRSGTCRSEGRRSRRATAP